VWLLNYHADRLVKVDKDTGALEGFASFTGAGMDGLYVGSSSFIGGVFDGQCVWMIPGAANRVVQVDKDTMVMTGFPSWTGTGMTGYVNASSAFIGGGFDGENVWLAPRSADRLVSINIHSGEYTGYPSWAGDGMTGFTLGVSRFAGAVYDGSYLLLVPRMADRVVRVGAPTATPSLTASVQPTVTPSRAATKTASFAPKTTPTGTASPALTASHSMELPTTAAATALPTTTAAPVTTAAPNTTAALTATPAPTTASPGGGDARADAAGSGSSSSATTTAAAQSAWWVLLLVVLCLLLAVGACYAAACLRCRKKDDKQATEEI
jgi:hypothetical protein